MTSVRLVLSRALLVGLVASLCVAASSPPASAEPTWLPTVDVATEIPMVNWYDVDHLPDDTTAVVWGEAPTTVDGTVYFATRGVGDAAFSSAEPLSEGYAWNPQIVVDEQGAVIVAWIQVANGQSVQVTRLAPGATDWSTPQIVSSHSVRSFQLLVDPAGTVTVLSLHQVEHVVPDVESTYTYRVDANVRLSGGEWSGAQVVAEEGPDEIRDLRAVVDATGTVRAVWEEGDGLSTRVHLASNDAAGAFVDTTMGATDVAAGAPDVTVTPGGGIAVSWGQQVAPGAKSEVAVVATRDPGASSFSEPEPVGGPQEEVLDTEVVVDGTGTTTVMSTALSFGEYAVIASSRGAGNLFSSRVLAATTGDVLAGLEVALGPDGSLTALWQLADDGSLARVQAAHRESGADFEGADELSPPDDPQTADDDAVELEPVVAVDSSGDATVLWERREVGAETSAIRSRVLDGAGPRFDEVVVPATATPGSQISLSVSAADHWSGPATIEWSFGDGATSLGASTSHAYAAPGTYQVSVTATDAVGNATTLVRALTVAAPPPPPPPPPALPPKPSDRVAPVLSKARVTPKTLSASRPAKVRVTSSEAAALVAVVQCRTNGRWKRLARKQWVVEAGANTEKLYGKAAQLRLRSGACLVRLTATDPASNTSATTTIRFRVDRG